MIGYLHGTIKYLSHNKCILEVNHVGYEVTTSSCQTKQIGDRVELYTSMQVHQDDISLYGFATLEELDFFKKLISISGIGPKAALSLLSSLSLPTLCKAILTKDSKLLASAPGIGKKTAERIALELQDKISLEDSLIPPTTSTEDVNSTQMAEAIEGLQALGYSSSHIYDAIAKSSITPDMDASSIISLLLRQLSLF